MANYCVPERDKAALLTLSAQRDFLRPGSPVKVSGGERAKPVMRRLVEGFRAQNARICHAIRLYRPDGSNVDACRRQAIEEGERVFMPGSLGAELLEELKPDRSVRLKPDCLLNGRLQLLGPNEWAFYRPRWGAFYGTPLEAHLRALGVSTLVICGMSFATGIRATVYEASARDFRTVVVPDALGSASEQGVRELGRLGVYLMTGESCLNWLAGIRSPCVPA
ncbi:MAG: cysteine hydrolase family protein [Kiloniellaceae bacterium]